MELKAFEANMRRRCIESNDEELQIQYGQLALEAQREQTLHFEQCHKCLDKAL